MAKIRDFLVEKQKSSLFVKTSLYVGMNYEVIRGKNYDLRKIIFFSISI